VNVTATPANATATPNSTPISTPETMNVTPNSTAVNAPAAPSNITPQITPNATPVTPAGEKIDTPELKKPEEKTTMFEQIKNIWTNTDKKPA